LAHTSRDYSIHHECEVTVKIEDADRNKVSAKAIGEDIVTTSVQAVIDGINRIMLKKMLKEKLAKN
jgi:2-isopropylmalate synthase